MFRQIVIKLVVNEKKLLTLVQIYGVRFPRYTVNRNRKRPQNTAYLEFPFKSNLVISSQNISNIRVILQVGVVLAIKLIIWYFLNNLTVSNLLKWFLFD